MKAMSSILKVIGWSIAGCFVVCASAVSIYVIKQMHTESVLKQFKKGQLGVYNKHGGIITTPQELLDELQGEI